jgi:nucleotidyltransferase substrate binding protein (TIGR01987 family)
VADIAQSIANLERAFRKLDEFAQLPIVNDRDKAGLVQAFEFTFELFWKTFQKLGPASGLTANSPREALIVGRVLRLIAPVEEETWLHMLQDRNLTSHTYNQLLADEIVQRILGAYMPCYTVTMSRLRTQTEQDLA